MNGWRVERIHGSAGVHHARELPVPLTRTAWVFTIDHPALVLGSTQSEDVVDRVALERLGAELVRRRSGGGAVWLEPSGTLWVDLLVPRADPLWDDDVGRAAHWAGAAWAQALGGATVHRGGMVCGAESGRVCFAGLGPGEVTVAGRKVVGVSQRRTRAGARFQCVAYDTWDPGPLAAVLRLSAAAGAGLDDVAAGVGRSLDEVAEALLEHLP